MVLVTGSRRSADLRYDGVVRLGASLVFIVVAAACGSGALDEVAPLDFGAVPATSSRLGFVELKNSGTGPLSLVAEVEPGDFAFDRTSFRLEPGMSARIEIGFTPTRLGPIEGVLRLHGDGIDRNVALRGIGIGASLEIPRWYSFHEVPLLEGGPASAVTGRLTVRNAGTAGSLLRLVRSRVDGADLCVGAVGSSGCTPWTPLVLEAGQSAEVPLVLTPTVLGPRRWTVTFTSDAPLEPKVAVSVGAVVEPAAPCHLSAEPAALRLVGDVGALTLRHDGPGRCVIEDVRLDSFPAGTLRWTSAPTLPVWLGPQERTTVGLALTHSTPGQVGGTVRVDGLGADPLVIPVSADPATCLVPSPADFDFGTVRVDCPLSPRLVALYNVCSRAVVVRGTRLVVPGGATSSEFHLMAAPPPETALAPGQPPLLLSVLYSPVDSGADSAALVVSSDEGDLVLSLNGKGDATQATNVDTFQQNPPLPRVDLLVLVDASPSFVPKRAAVRANLAAMLPRFASVCADERWSFAAADGAPGAAPVLLADDAGVTRFSSLDAGFVDRALAAFDSLPVGSEVEACLGPAAALVAGSDGGARPGAQLDVMCVTDALDQTTNPAAALASLRSATSHLSWSAVTGTTSSTCAIEAPDDGSQAALVASTYGVSADICDATWWTSFSLGVMHGCGGRSQFYLTARPAAAGAVVEVRIDGVVVAATTPAGERVWRYDPASNAVIFEPGHQPPPSSRLEVAYSIACPP